MHTTMRFMTGAAAAAVLGLGAWAPAHADPVNAKNAFPIQISCDNGQSYVAVANGNGNFTPAHDLSSTAILVPIAFGPITFTVTAPDGTILDQETDPATAKPGASMHNKHAATNCDFAGSATAPDGTTFSIEGSVTGFVTK
jgi:hypothetical protein